MLVALAGTLLVGCSSGPTVRLRVENAEGGPVSGALVHAAPIAMSEVPLPVSLETLSEAGVAGASGVTDERGEIVLRLNIDRPHDLAVTPPFTENDPQRRRTWRGRFDGGAGGSGGVEPIEQVPGLTVRTMEPSR